MVSYATLENVETLIGEIYSDTGLVPSVKVYPGNFNPDTNPTVFFAVRSAAIGSGVTVENVWNVVDFVDGTREYHCEVDVDPLGDGIDITELAGIINGLHTSVIRDKFAETHQAPTPSTYEDFVAIINALPFTSDIITARLHNVAVPQAEVWRAEFNVDADDDGFKYNAVRGMVETAFSGTHYSSSSSDADGKVRMVVSL